MKMLQNASSNATFDSVAEEISERNSVVNSMERNFLQDNDIFKITLININLTILLS